MRKVRLFQWFLILVVMLSSSLAWASVPDVSADRTYYDINTGFYMLEGNVVVHVKDVEIQAPSARVSLATMEVYAEGGINVFQGGASFSGDSVYINGRERHAYIDGNIRMEDNGMTITGSRADFNWRTKDVVLSDVTITDGSGQRCAAEAVYNVRSKSLSY